MKKFYHIFILALLPLAISFPPVEELNDVESLKSEIFTIAESFKGEGSRF